MRRGVPPSVSFGRAQGRVIYGVPVGGVDLGSYMQRLVKRATKTELRNELKEPLWWRWYWTPKAVTKDQKFAIAQNVVFVEPASSTWTQIPAGATANVTPLSALPKPSHLASVPAKLAAVDVSDSPTKITEDDYWLDLVVVKKDYKFDPDKASPRKFDNCWKMLAIPGSHPGILRIQDALPKLGTTHTIQPDDFSNPDKLSTTTCFPPQTIIQSTVGGALVAFRPITYLFYPQLPHSLHPPRFFFRRT